MQSDADATRQIGSPKFLLSIYGERWGRKGNTLANEVTYLIFIICSGL